MTTYSAIANSEIDAESPITDLLLTRFRDNPLAIAEGDATAPSLLVGIAAKSTAGGVGTYMFARSTTASDLAFGSTRAGSTLTPTSALYGWNSLSTNVGNFDVGAAQSGTWMAMGTYDHLASISAASGATLWLRIS